MEVVGLFFGATVAVLTAHSKLSRAPAHLKQLSGDHCVKDCELVTFIDTLNIFKDVVH